MAKGLADLARTLLCICRVYQFQHQYARLTSLRTTPVGVRLFAQCTNAMLLVICDMMVRYAYVAHACTQPPANAYARVTDYHGPCLTLILFRSCQYADIMSRFIRLSSNLLILRTRFVTRNVILDCHSVIRACGPNVASSSSISVPCTKR